MIEVKKTYVFFVPPGWLLVGTVAEISESHVRLRESAYLEMTEQDASPLSGLPQARTVAAIKKIVSKSWPLAGGTVLALPGILIATPWEGAAPDVIAHLTRAHDAATIRGAR